MKRAVLADTGPLYAAADIDDAHHRRALAELNRLAHEKREVLVAYPILCEAYTLVLFRLGKAAASSWLNDVLRGVSMINPVPEDYLDARRKLAAFVDQPITLFDAVVAVMGKRMSVEVWTYDHHFELMRASVWH